MNSLLDKYKDCHLGKSAVIFSCGPSLTQFDEGRMREFCSDKVVFTVKQAGKKYKDISDYHFFNDNNFCFYGNKAVNIASAANPGWAKKVVWGSQEVDFVFKIIRATGNITDSLSHRKDFKNMLLSTNLDRPWGPGIMYETVLPFVIHTGIKEIYINGWDYTTKNGLLKHYYNEERAKKVLVNTGRNIGQMSDGEKDCFLKSTEFLYDFLKERDIQVKLISKCSEISPKFERKNDI